MIENKTKDYSSHKHNFTVYVEINSKTKLGQDLLEQYRKQAKYQYSDIGRIGYHDDYGRYIIDHYTLFELISIPKLIITVTESAVDRAGKDVYKLRTYMSKFGQLNFILLVDRSCAELILVENVFIENLNHKEDYETSIYKLRYSPREQVPLREIFYKFGIKANPDDYGKCWKNEQSSINNIIVAKAKAEMTINIANKIASNINQKALVTSLNYLNKENSYGKNVTKEYSKKVSKSKELNNLSTSPKLENTLNNVLVKTLEQQTTKADVKDKTNFKIYKKVLDVELSSHNEVKKEVNKANNKQNLKEFMLNTYSKPSSLQEDENKINEKKFKTFETIIEKHYDRTPNKELAKPVEEDFKTKEITAIMPEKEKNQDFYDFDNKKVNVDFNLDRFKKPEEETKKKEKKKQEKVLKKLEKKQSKIEKKQNKNSKILDAECNLDEEFEKSKRTLGILPTDSKKKKKKALKIFFSDDNKKHKKQDKKEKKQTLPEEENKLSIMEKIEKQIRLQKEIRNKKEVNNKKEIINKKEVNKKDKTKLGKFEKIGLQKKEKQIEKPNKKAPKLSKEDKNFLKEYEVPKTTQLEKPLKNKKTKTKLNKTTQSKPKKITKLKNVVATKLKEKQEKKKKKNARNLILDLEDKKANKKQTLFNNTTQKTSESNINTAKTKESTTKTNLQDQLEVRKSSTVKTNKQEEPIRPNIKPPVEKAVEITPKKTENQNPELQNKRSGKEVQLQNYFNKKQSEQQDVTPPVNTPVQNVKSNFSPVTEHKVVRKKQDFEREM